MFIYILWNKLTMIHTQKPQVKYFVDFFDHLSLALFTVLERIIASSKKNPWFYFRGNGHPFIVWKAIFFQILITELKIGSSTSACLLLTYFPLSYSITAGFSYLSLLWFFIHSVTLIIDCWLNSLKANQTSYIAQTTSFSLFNPSYAKLCFSCTTKHSQCWLRLAQKAVMIGEVGSVWQYKQQSGTETCHGNTATNKD